jgi:transposase
LAKNDPIDAEMIAWFAETFSQAPGQVPDAAREELAALAKARKALVDVKIRLLAQNEHAAPEPARKAHARILKSLAAEIDKPGHDEREAFSAGIDRDDSATTPTPPPVRADSAR